MLVLCSVLGCASSFSSTCSATDDFQGCSTAHVPAELGTEAAASAGFTGLVFHSADFGARRSDFLEAVLPKAQAPDAAPIVVVGGGKSAQEYVRDCRDLFLFRALMPCVYIQYSRVSCE